ncbi:TraR/DksA family transcriptional regulator [Patescibacteria group bacterium]|nr:TraR/DksA family transcriptional regulator [Candidatus Falkowbacteria bacterium]MBU3906199.1 TraR/DksA family transcriptional regulator [Patescibacteria group bacterium]MCG2698317.1 TraR/DksA family transcriptional regulator [Candidatus Parcubacteria bacterium]MBU4015578.1 TraR/DksA family transcriptional regulator [Patescibacteria group bacterium]MBU4026357.1 TraR/DksA family transcriptional regulator [Patescibacteria group bacterium]
MDKKVADKIKKDLLARKQQIEGDLDSFTKDDKHEKDEHRAKFPDFGNKSDENVQEIGAYSTNLATEKILEKTLIDIEDALDRINKGSYGVCKYCGQEIEKKRLLARPVSSACIECKNKLQKAV